jgi:uncharacterized membrane protein
MRDPLFPKNWIPTERWEEISRGQNKRAYFGIVPQYALASLVRYMPVPLPRPLARPLAIPVILIWGLASR